MNILIVDDNESCRKVLADFIRSIGHTVSECDNGQDALTMISQQNFQLIISDIKMPMFSGIDLLKAISALPFSKDTYVVLVTGYGDMDSAIEALRAGAYDYILKPINVRQIAAIIEDIEKKSKYNKTKILIASKNSFCKIALKTIINQSRGYYSIVEASNDDECLSITEEIHPQIVVIDDEVCHDLKFFDKLKEISSQMKIIVLASTNNKHTKSDYFQKAVDAYLSKKSNIEEIIYIFDKVLHGEKYIDPNVAKILENNIEKRTDNKYELLTDREKLILYKLANGSTTKEIAKELYLAESTIRNYISSLLKKLELRNRSEAIAYAIKHLEDNNMK